MVSYYLLTENIIEMTELETQIWNTVHNWCDAQSNEIPDQNRRYLMDEIKTLVLSHAVERSEQLKCGNSNPPCSPNIKFGCLECTECNWSEY